MPKASVNGIDLYYESRGQGPAIVFAHGAGGNHQSWWQQVPAFSKEYQCVTFDHRGWGSSMETPNGPGRGAFVEDLKQLLEHLGIEKTFLVSQSMGGRTCLGFALAYPQRTLGLVLGDTIGGAGDPELADAIKNVGPSPEGLGRTLSRGFIQGEPEKTFLYEEIGAMNPPRQDGGAAAPTGMAAGLPSLGIPTLLVVGEDDALVPPDLMRALHGLIPDSSLEVVAGAAHSTHFEQPEVFNRLVSEFFAKVLSIQVAGAPAD